MSKKKELSGNVGEWSEVYVFFHLLGNPVLTPCDAELNICGNTIPVVAILRGKGPEGNLTYILEKGEKIEWKVYIDGELKSAVLPEEGKEEAAALLAGILEQRSKGMKFPKAEKFLSYLHDNRIKASGLEKGDISLRVDDIRAGHELTCGFSIKSYLGSDPTLFNANKDATNLLYHVKGIDKETVRAIEEEVAQNPKKKIKVLMKALNEHCAELSFCGALNPTLERNLRYIDISMPQVLGELLLTHYVTGEKSVAVSTAIMAENDPLHTGDRDLYAYKVKKLLEAVALGMTPAKPWKGDENANGGFIIVKPDGDVVTYHLYNRMELNEYLFEHTYFDHPSTSRHLFADLFYEGEELYLKLAIQIRFSRP